jgi:outer membrane protein OmpA-like peptidoglycan-associated protein
LDSATTKDFQKLSDYLNQHPDRLVDVTGYTCNISSAAFNKRLGMARAMAVRDRLVALDVAPERIRVASGGEENPLANNQTTAGQEANRRVDLLIR